MNSDKLNKLERANERVKKIKGFYNHLLWYIIINVVLIIIEFRVYNFFNIEVTINEDFSNWMNWNFIVTPLVWGIGLAFHGLCVFRYKFGFFNKWEKRQIEKYMHEDNSGRWE